jgi:hypothetical protein
MFAGNVTLPVTSGRSQMEITVENRIRHDTHQAPAAWMGPGFY